jgi:hypothetical protein
MKTRDWRLQSNGRTREGPGARILTFRDQTAAAAVAARPADHLPEAKRGDRTLIIKQFSWPALRGPRLRIETISKPLTDTVVSSLNNNNRL